MNHRNLIIALFLFIIWNVTLSQNSHTTSMDSFRSVRYIDLHCHSTLKNYVNMIPSTYSIYNFQSPQQLFQDVRRCGWDTLMWQDQKKVNRRKLENGTSAHFKAYNQADYGHIARSNCGIVVNSLCEIEKFTIRRKSYMGILHSLTHIERKRIQTFKQTTNSAWLDFNLEYYLSVCQDSSYQSSPEIVPVRNTADIIRNEQNNKTSLINSLEGAHTLFGSYFSQRKYLWRYDLSVDHNLGILPLPSEPTEHHKANLFYLDKKHQQELQYITTYQEDYKGIKHEILSNIDSLKRMEYPILYAGLAHHDWNQLCGYAWSKDQRSRFVRQILTGFYSLHIIEHNYWYKGITPLGQRVMLKLLSIDTTSYHLKVLEKPILIDVKHMGLRSRLDFYKMIDSLNKINHCNIPIICSHTGVAGRDFNLSDTKLKIDTNVSPYLTKCRNEIYAFKRQDYKALNDRREDLKEAGSLHHQYVGWFFPWQMNLYDEDIRLIMHSKGLIGIMVEQRTLKGGDNYFDERSIVMTDRPDVDTVKGMSLIKFSHENPNYKIYRKYKNADKMAMKDFYVNFGNRINISEAYRNLFFDSNSLKKGKYILKDSIQDHLYSLEPFVRNIFYAVEKSGLIDTSEAWDHICLGSDFDGNIDPIDAFATSDKMEYFQNLIKLFVPYFVQQNTEYDIKVHYKKMHTPTNPYATGMGKMRVNEKLLLKIDKENILDKQTVYLPNYPDKLNEATDRLLQKIFYDNAHAFIMKYYAKSWYEILNPK